MLTKTLRTLALAALIALPVLAQPAEPARPGKAEPAAEKTIVEEKRSLTRHTATVGGERIDYTATAGTLVLETEEGESRASIFYVAYTRNGVADPGKRPLTFSFNGGPGSSSVWLHLGTLGPRRVAMDDEGHALPPPYRLEENPYSILDLTDLVFIDPVSTGFSRPAPGVEQKEFHGVEKDVESVGEFIRRWTSENGRWASPKYLIGESYGTTRAAGLVNHLQDRHGLYFNGVMLVSSILNFGTARFDVGNDLPYILFLPTYTATAWYHGRLPEDLSGDLQAALREAEEFAQGDYALALLRGDALPAEERRRTAERLARLTGLSVAYLEGARLRPVIHRFTKELLRQEGKTVGRLDSRFVGFDREDVGERTEFDPSYAAIQGSFTAALNAYVRDELEFESGIDYEILGGRIRGWPSPEGRYVNVAEELRRAMTQNPALKVHVANGYYDLATPYFATEYTFDHLGLPEHLRENVSMSYYESGHMMYIRQSDLVKLKEELARFIRESDGL
ncbi:MAG TPA: peptidase S10 [Thermoanaerobaculia bacterium]|nr:peptidase S10 [Thermoanaerobaculia bacterium]